MNPRKRRQQLKRRRKRMDRYWDERIIPLAIDRLMQIAAKYFEHEVYGALLKPLANSLSYGAVVDQTGNHPFGQMQKQLMQPFSKSIPAIPGTIITIHNA